MRVIEGISAQGMPVLGTYSLKLNRHPLIVIRGRNLDKKSKENKNSNGSGKTLCVSPIPTIIYESTPNSLKKKATKDLLKVKNSFIELQLDNNGRKHKIRQTLTSSVKYSITTNGKEENYRESTVAKAKINKLFPMSQEQFYSQVFIEGRQKTILQAGTPAQRFAYLETIFNLNQFDTLNAQASKDYSRVKSYLQELQVIVAEKNERKKGLPILDAAKLNVKQGHIEEKIQDLNTKVEKYIDSLNSTKTYISIAEDLDTDVPLKTLKRQLDESHEEYETMQALYKKSVRNYELLEQDLALQEKRKKYKTQYNLIEGDVSDIQTFKAKAFNLNDNRMHIATNILEEKSRRLAFKKLKEQLKTLDLKAIPEKYAKFSETKLSNLLIETKAKLREKKETISNLEEFLEHEHTEQVCPTCQRGLSKNTAKDLIETLTKAISSYKNRIVVLKQVIEFKTIKDQMDEFKFDDLEALVEQHDKMESRINRWEEKIEQLEKKAKLKELLRDLPKQDETLDASMPKPFVYEDTIQDLNKRIAHLQQSIKTHARLKKLDLSFDSVEQAKEKSEAYKRRLNEYRPVLQELQKDLQELVSQSSVYNSIQDDIKRLLAKIKELKIETQDFKILEALKKAFGPKGLRKTLIKWQVEQLQNKFNKYSHLIYDEPIKFMFQVTETKFDILCELNGNIMDARKLSGAESSAFTLLLLLCLLPSLPNSRRSNLLVLDEIESGCDQGTLAKFIDSFLPVLQKVVPNIVIITPRSEKEFYIPNAENYIVTKQNGKSIIKHVKPGEMVH